METNLLTITNARFLMAVEYQKNVVGYTMTLLDVDNNTHQETLGMFDIFRAPISDILISKGKFKLTVENNLPVIIDASGNKYNYEFFERMEKTQGKKYTVSVAQLPQQTQNYLKEQDFLFKQHIVNKTANAQPVVQQQPAPQPVQQSVVQQPAPQPVQQSVVQQPIQVQQPVQQPVAQSTQAPVQSTNQSVVDSVLNKIRRNPNELISTDEFPVGTFLVRSVIDPNERLPEYRGLNEKGEKVYGPDRYTEEECIAVIQLKNLVYSAGEHLLTEKEKQLIDEMNEGRDEKGNTEADGIDMMQLGVVDTLNKIRATMLQKITTARKAEKNVLQIRDAVQHALKANVPFELMGTKYSFYYMSMLDEDGNPFKTHPTFLERANQLSTHGKLISSPKAETGAGFAKPQVTPSAPVQPVTPPNTFATPSAGARPVATGGSPQQLTPNNSPFTRPTVGGFNAPKSNKSATAIIKKFITVDGTTIEGLVFDVNGTIQGQAVNRRCANSLEALGRAYSGLSRQLDFTNATLVMNNGKLEVSMTDEHLNAIDIKPENRFIYADEISKSSTPIGVLLSKDARLLELVELAKTRHANGAPTTQVGTTPVQEVTPVQPVTTTAPQPTPSQAVQPVVTPTQTQAKPMPETVKQFIDLLNNTNAVILPITDVSSGVPQVVMLNVAEIKQYLGI